MKTDRSEKAATRHPSGSVPDPLDSQVGAKLNQAAERFSTLLHTKPEPDVSTDSTPIIERPPFGRRPAASTPARGSDETHADIAGEDGKSSHHDEPPGPIIDSLIGQKNRQIGHTSTRTSEQALDDEPIPGQDSLVGRQHPETTITGEFVQVIAKDPSNCRSSADRQSGRHHADAKSDRVSTDGQPVRPPSAFIIGESGRANIGQAKTSQTSGITQSKPNESSSSGSDCPMGDRILQGLGQQRATVENPSTPETSATQTSDRVEQIEGLGERLAQRILVTDRGEVGDSEVRIQLRESVLQGGEIRLRQEHGQLVVSIQIPSTDLARQLSGQTDTLQQTLANRLETPVRVEVQVVGARDAGHDANPGDGRSRNRRDPWDAYEDQGA